jgi:hypothetical protein
MIMIVLDYYSCWYYDCSCIICCVNPTVIMIASDCDYYNIGHHQQQQGGAAAAAAATAAACL